SNSRTRRSEVNRTDPLSYFDSVAPPGCSPLSGEFDSPIHVVDKAVTEQYAVELTTAFCPVETTGTVFVHGSTHVAAIADGTCPFLVIGGSVGEGESAVANVFAGAVLVVVTGTP